MIKNSFQKNCVLFDGIGRQMMTEERVRQHFQGIELSDEQLSMIMGYVSEQKKGNSADRRRGRVSEERISGDAGVSKTGIRR